jgi:F-type H+-transporting ATPase subunit gamma
MASLRDIRRKIKSIKNTQQITKAMKMVAAARLRKAQTRILSARRYADKMEQMMTDLLIRIEGEESHPLFRKRAGERRALLLITSDKGLCGAFNTNLIREAMKYIRKYGAQNVHLFVVGRKGRDYFRRLGLSVLKEYVNIFNNLGFEHAEIILQDVVEAYLGKPHPTLRISRDKVVTLGDFAAVDVLYNEFKSVVQQKVVLKALLPLLPMSVPVEKMRSDFIYEPNKEVLIEGLIPRFLKTRVFRVLLESAASELGARMSAMENATKNASELMESLTLTLNRTRQTSITTEILEVVSGAEALK